MRPDRRSKLVVRWLPTLLAPGLMLAGSLALAASSVYVTWAGPEPDKGACAWYIKRFVDTQAVFKIVDHGAPLPQGTAFDVPQSKYRRTHNASSFQNLLRSYPSEDPVVQKIAAITHDIEINLWRPKVLAETWPVEQRMQDIGSQFSPGAVPIRCFIDFFDNVYQWLEQQKTDVASLMLPKSCNAKTGSTVQQHVEPQSEEGETNE